MRLLLDTNTLLLLIVGTLRPDRIGGKRLEAFDYLDFELVSGLARQIPRHVSTPHILAEASNFIGSGPQQLVEGGTIALAEYIGLLEEVYVPAFKVAVLPEFLSLGLTDAAIHHLADETIRVVSIDYHLCNRLASKGVDTINPRNLRTPGYVPS